MLVALVSPEGEEGFACGGGGDVRGAVELLSDDETAVVAAGAGRGSYLAPSLAA